MSCGAPIGKPQIDEMSRQVATLHQPGNNRAMTQIRPDGATVARDPLWHAHRYDPQYDAFHFRYVPREAHRASIFLTDEYLPSDDGPVVVTRSEAIASAGTPAPLHFIFHSAFCLSTLLARAFDVPGIAMGLKEPMVFNDLSGWKHRGGKPADIARVLDSALTMLARPFGPGETVVVKPSNIVNPLIAAALAMRPTSHALLLEAPLRTYLSSIAKKEMTGRLWVRDLLVKLLKDGLIDLGFELEDFLGQTDLQVAAVGWLAQHALFARLAGQYPGRIRTLDSETLLAQPAKAMAALVAHFGMPLDEAAISEIVSGPAFTRHSKFGTEFGGEARAAEYRDAAAVHADEIDKAAIWAEAVANTAGVSMSLPASLLG